MFRHRTNKGEAMNDAPRVSRERIDAMLDDLIHCVRSHERSPDKYTADEIMIARRVIKDELLALRTPNEHGSALAQEAGQQPAEPVSK